MHIHLPDGVLPVWLWAAGLAIAAITVAFSAFMLRKGLNKKAAMIGVFAALMLVAMNIPLGPIPYHINLTA
ncbi:MAG TPA: energy-coupling factor ABC transporter permease, partial [Candidatus Bilamarchaeaceae archaeon]|nr:energy-coupling factor ABC transporter permease [Candidatus Bilamarchaeaceae archaeon]